MNASWPSHHRAGPPVRCHPRSVRRRVPRGGYGVSWNPAKACLERRSAGGLVHCRMAFIGPLSFGSPADYVSPVALRPHLAVGLPLSLTDSGWTSPPPASRPFTRCPVRIGTPRGLRDGPLRGFHPHGRLTRGAAPTHGRRRWRRQVAASAFLHRGVRDVPDGRVAAGARGRGGRRTRRVREPHGSRPGHRAQELETAVAELRAAGVDVRLAAGLRHGPQPRHPPHAWPDCRRRHPPVDDHPPARRVRAGHVGHALVARLADVGGRPDPPPAGRSPAQRQGRARAARPAAGRRAQGRPSHRFPRFPWPHGSGPTPSGFARTRRRGPHAACTDRYRGTAARRGGRNSSPSADRRRRVGRAQYSYAQTVSARVSFNRSTPCHPVVIVYADVARVGAGEMVAMFDEKSCCTRLTTRPVDSIRW